jgi:CO/xanthine dehydrogenase Mo-binding subunit
VPAPDGSLTLWASTQGVFGVRDDVCTILGLAPEQVRVRAPWVGGGFGAKGGTYPEQVLVAALARRLGRPVRWVETRTENLLGMTHGRAQTHDVTVINFIAKDADDGTSIGSDYSNFGQAYHSIAGMVIALLALVILFVSAFWRTDEFTGALVRDWNLDNFRTIFESPTS